MLLLATVAILADRLAPYNPLTANYAITRDPPLARHVLGTDHLGRDVLSRIIFGARVTLLVAISSVLLGDTIGFVWGVASGYLGGRVDLISQRVLDVLMSLPSLILALLLMAALGAGLTTVIVAIAVTRVPLEQPRRQVDGALGQGARLRGGRQVLGASGRAVMARHVAPQCVAPFLIITTGHLGAAIFIEAALSFVGVGVPPPDAELGQHAGRRARRGLQAAVVDGGLPRAWPSRSRSWP